MKTKKKILFIAWEFTPGGAALLALRYIQRLISIYDIDFLITGPADARMLSRLPVGVGLFRLQMGHRDTGAYSLGEQDSLGSMELFLQRQKIEPLQRDYDAVLGTSVFPDWRACVALSLSRSRRKIIFLVDEGLVFFSKQSLRERTSVESCLLAADLILSVSRKLWTTITPYCPPLAERPFEVMLPPVDEVDLSSSSGETAGLVPSDLPLVLTVARLVPDKQILENVRAQARLRDLGIDFRWVVLGEGPEEPRLRLEIKALGLEDRFLLMGHQQAVYPWLVKCDLFVLLSKSEGSSMVVLEAIHAGKPVLMTDVNGADELIQNGRTGLIVPNDPIAIDAALTRLLLDRKLIDEFSRNIQMDPPLSDAARETERLVRLLETRQPREARPEVSILIPTYNQQEFLDQAVSSALMQNFQSLEVVVLDDASTDKTRRLCQKWKSDPRFRYVRNQANLGRVDNYRKAIVEIAQGDWALMLDGDDYLTDPGFIRRAREAIGRQTGRKILFAQAGHRIHFTREKKPDVDLLPPISEAEKCLAGADYLKFVFQTGFFTHLGILFDRQEAVRCGCYTAPISSSDMDSFLRLALEGEVLLLNTIAGCWVQHGDNASAQVPFHLISSNTRIFRSVARMAIERGLTSRSRIEPHLSRYEAQTLAFLFNQSLALSQENVFPWLKIWSVALSVNPGLMTSIRFIASYFRMVRKFIKRRLIALGQSLWRGQASRKDSA